MRELFFPQAVDPSKREVCMTKTVKNEKAKQGRWGTQVLTILAVSLVLVFIVWGIAEIYGQLIAPS
ncbi:hypothetical protein DUT91_00275 [Phyllobacterium salinisoli]|uniref:Uncharacterized protein n=1 Tax=Phyllobacterium salinisoli TaxID=1899321 RepID=A0A368K7G5_9HYPH|nr:hypothetical protein DUT91_00275 [Phyllobacterium salinisoli]